MKLKVMSIDKNFQVLTIFEFSIIHSSCVFKCSWENVVLTGALEKNGFCKIWGANKVYYRGFENRELTIACIA